MKKLMIISLVLLTFAANAADSQYDKVESGQLVRHVVSFQFKKDITPEDLKNIDDNFRAMKQKIKYIVSIESGDNVSKEGVLSQRLEFTKTYIVTFKNIADKDYYVDQDPVHDAFKKLVGPSLRNYSEDPALNDAGSSVIVLDFLANPA